MAKVNARSSNNTKQVKRSNKGTKRTYLSELCYQLEKAAAGLMHRSESDYPYLFFSLMPRSLPSEHGKLTDIEFLRSIGLSQEFIDEYEVNTKEWIVEKPFNNFLPSVEKIANYYGFDVNNRKVVAEAKRYRNLEKVILKRLRDVKVFRVGKIDVRCYIAGLTKQGQIAGLVTTAIET